MDQRWDNHLLTKSEVKALESTWNMLQTEALFQSENATGVLKLFSVDGQPLEFPAVFQRRGPGPRGDLALADQLDVAREEDRVAIQKSKEKFFSNLSLVQIIRQWEAQTKVSHRTTKSLIHAINDKIRDVEFGRDIPGSPFYGLSDTAITFVKMMYFGLKLVLIDRFSGPQGRQLANIHPDGGDYMLFSQLERDWFAGREGQDRSEEIINHFRAGAR